GRPGHEGHLAGQVSSGDVGHGGASKGNGPAATGRPVAGVSGWGQSSSSSSSRRLASPAFSRSDWLNTSSSALRTASRAASPDGVRLYWILYLRLAMAISSPGR